MQITQSPETNPQEPRPNEHQSLQRRLIDTRLQHTALSIYALQATGQARTSMLVYSQCLVPSEVSYGVLCCRCAVLVLCCATGVCGAVSVVLCLWRCVYGAVSVVPCLWCRAQTGCERTQGSWAAHTPNEMRSPMPTMVACLIDWGTCMNNRT